MSVNLWSSPEHALEYFGGSGGNWRCWLDVFPPDSGPATTEVEILPTALPVFGWRSGLPLRFQALKTERLLAAGGPIKAPQRLKPFQGCSSLAALKRCSTHRPRLFWKHSPPGGLCTGEDTRAYMGFSRVRTPVLHGLCTGEDTRAYMGFSRVRTPVLHGLFTGEDTRAYMGFSRVRAPAPTWAGFPAGEDARVYVDG